MPTHPRIRQSPRHHARTGKPARKGIVIFTVADNAPKPLQDVEAHLEIATNRTLVLQAPIDPQFNVAPDIRRLS